MQEADLSDSGRDEQKSRRLAQRLTLGSEVSAGTAVVPTAAVTPVDKKRRQESKGDGVIPK